MPELESSIQKKILAYLKTLPHTWAIKTIQTNRKGVPDIICCIKGKFVAFEVKNAKGKLSPHQIHEGKSIIGSGGAWYVVRSLDEVKTILENIGYNGIKLVSGEDTELLQKKID